MFNGGNYVYKTDLSGEFYNIFGNNDIFILSLRDILINKIF